MIATIPHDVNSTDSYTLLDFGNGRRLERFGPLLLDRLCPAAENLRPENPNAWRQVDVRFIADDGSRKKNSERGRWQPLTGMGRDFFSVTKTLPWTVSFGSIRFELRGTPFGHVGVFPEQQTNWTNMTTFLARAARMSSKPLRILNLFAYTGGSSLAAALAAPEIEVVHVDSSKSVVDWARRNAALNGVERGIRFIVEDARKFVARELKRNNRYDVVILDPPTYGHGFKGEVWKLSEHLPDLLADLVSLTGGKPLSFLLTAHTPGLDVDALKRMLLDAGLDGTMESSPLTIPSESGRLLPSGNGVLYEPENGIS